MLIRRRTLRFALHEKSVTLTFDGSKQISGVHRVLAQHKRNVEPAEPPSTNGLTAPPPTGWLRRILWFSGRNANLLLALLAVACCHLQR